MREKSKAWQTNQNGFLPPQALRQLSTNILMPLKPVPEYQSAGIGGTG